MNLIHSLVITVAVMDFLTNAFVNSQNIDLASPAGIGYTMGQSGGIWLAAFVIGGTLIGLYRGTRWTWRKLTRA